jgi:ubiquinone biosynthesis protein
MGISLRPERLRRYRDVARLLWKYGRSDLVRQSGLDEALDPETRADGGSAAEAQELADDLERMGPTYVKLGQILSTRADVLPRPYLDALTRLQDRVTPVPIKDIVDIVESELAMPLHVAFPFFDETPLAAASLGQVHRATLPDGAAVAVKVQRPDVRAVIAEDLAALRDIAEFLDAHTDWGRRHRSLAVLEEFRRTLMDELDYRVEAQNLTTLATNLAEFELIVVPLPVDGLTTSRVLTMDFVRGRKITSVATLGRRERDGAALAEELFRAYLRQILVDGFFHADPHPGNVFLTDDGRLALLDLGMTARIGPDLQDKLLQWLLAIAEGRAEDAAEAAVRIGTPRDDFDESTFRRRVARVVVRHGGATELRDIEVGRIVLEAARISADCGIDVPRELTMLGRTLLHLDHVGRALDPDFDPNASVRRNAAGILERRVAKSLSPANIFATLLQAKEFVGRLPSRVNRILESAAENRFEIKVDAIDEDRLISGLHKIANRITVGLVLAALIVAAAMLARVPTRFELMGYPGLAILLFLAAAGGGTILVASIVLHDRRTNRRS